MNGYYAIRYLLATAGVRDKDLYALDHPVQIRDVLVLPVNGFKYVLFYSFLRCVTLIFFIFFLG